MEPQTLKVTNFEIINLQLHDVQKQRITQCHRKEHPNLNNPSNTHMIHNNYTIIKLQQNPTKHRPKNKTAPTFKKKPFFFQYKINNRKSFFKGGNQEKKKKKNYLKKKNQ
jgi:hypothetical protein